MLLGAIGAFILPLSSSKPIAKPYHSRTLVLAALVETLVPRDKTPSARDLDVHHDVEALEKDIPNYRQLLDAGTRWFDQTSRMSFGTDFGSLNDAKRGLVVTAAFASESGTLPRVFATRLRMDVMRLYYQRQESWQGMIDAPPQPMGYPDANLPPFLP